MLEELDYSNIPNYALVDDAYKNTSYDPENKYSVPYTWGTVGIIYNKKYVSESDLGSWDLLWNDKYSGKILMFDNPRDAYAISELLLGIDINSEDQDELRSAAYKLIEQKPLVQGYVMDQIFSAMERDQPGVQRRAQVADVHIARGAGSESRAHLALGYARLHLLKPCHIHKLFLRNIDTDSVKCFLAVVK